ncbi:MAG: LacI family transcriptional regulator, partial [Planctomycetes bacterium]|nr:LacI family transcriptional regulator [Planctomycetota bacterium]
MASIKDVARLAGVSIATVSRAINNLDVVSDDTRRKIEWAVKQQGYNPNLAARSLKQQSAKLLGFLVPDIENPYYATLARRMEAEASKAGFSLILCNTDGKIKSEEHYLKLLAGRLVDGVILCRGHIREASLPGFKGKKIKLVVLEKSDEDDSRTSIMIDNLEVGKLIAAHLVENRHRRLACIMEDAAVLPFARRMRGFVEQAGT